ncbi:hypothetical protein CH367_10475 [Leptospira barantonii]|uniref:Uncharacterized protein n=1 Tax=Leptospira barantonii TaxID=2023184 RepID=A0ABX4NK26_9LEPT|nr:hypothetical protein CH367_10475 [Leptospira barantonii]
MLIFKKTISLILCLVILIHSFYIWFGTAWSAGESRTEMPGFVSIMPLLFLFFLMQNLIKLFKNLKNRILHTFIYPLPLLCIYSVFYWKIDDLIYITFSSCSLLYIILEFFEFRIQNSKNA